MLDGVRRLLVRFFAVDTRPPEVPVGEAPEVFRASTKHLTYLFAAWAIRQAVMTAAFLIPVFVAIVAIVVKGELVWLAWLLGIVFIGGFVVVALIDYAAIRLDWEMRWYVLTDRALRIREGVLNVREVTLTLANVQDLKVSQGPIQRALGILDVVVDTAGGGGGLKDARDDSHRGVLRGIERGSEIKSKIEQRVKQRKGAGLGDPDDHHDHHDQHALPATATTNGLLDALREMRDEAKRLRAAASKDA